MAQPFGLGMIYHSPSQKLGAVVVDQQDESYAAFLATPTDRNLREMQSFESVLTARQDDPHPDTEQRSPKTKKRFKESVPAAFRLHRQPSAVHLSQRTQLGPISPSFETTSASTKSSPRTPSTPLAPDGVLPFHKPFTEHYNLAPLTQMQTRYTTEIFDLLQTSRGIPSFDSLIDDPNTVIKLSSTEENLARPRDDPRFVIWGDLDSGKPQGSGTDGATFHESHSGTASSVASSSISRKRSTKAGSGSSPSVPSLNMSSSSLSSLSNTSSAGGNQRLLIAATIERWIAQLTSELNYDELLNFFLTYRTYLSSVDLCHLLIARFHWSLEVTPVGSPSSSDPKRERLVQDELCRRIVRLRTFVAFRYWILTFFTVDFLPSRELRLLIAGWLNTLKRDPVLKKTQDGMSTVRKLRKVLLDCKKTHVKTAASIKSSSSAASTVSIPLPPSSATSPSSSRRMSVDYSVPEAPDTSAPPPHVLGEKFAAAVRDAETSRRRQQEQEDAEDPDLDLDFFPDEIGVDDLSMRSPGSGFQSDPANAHLTAHFSASAAGTLRSLRSGSLSQSAGSEEAIPSPFIPSPIAMPMHHNTLSRVFVNTMGRLGRWKRVLNSRSSASGSGLADAGPKGGRLSPNGKTLLSAFDLELNASRDLLNVNGGVERYLQLIETSSPTQRQLIGASPPPAVVRKPVSSTVTSVLDDGKRTSQTPISSSTSTPTPTPLSPVVEPATDSVDSADAVSVMEITRSPENGAQPGEHQPISDAASEIADQGLRPGSIAPSIASSTNSSVASYRSSGSEDFGVPIRSRFAPANAMPYNFDVVSIDELDLSDNSSDEAGPAQPPGLSRVTRKLPLRRDFEFVRRSESLSSMGLASRDSMASDTSSNRGSESFSEIDIGAGGIQPWQVNALLDSLTDDGEDGDVEAALRRLEGEIAPGRQEEKEEKVNGWVKNIQKRMATGDIGDNKPRFTYDSDEEEDEGDSTDQNEANIPEDDRKDSQFITISSTNADQAATPLATKGSYSQETLAIGPSQRNAGGAKQPSLEDVVPIEILQSRMPAESPSQPTQFSSPTNKILSGDGAVGQIYYSMIMQQHADALAEHFAMIDRELFMAVRFEELVSGDWMSCPEVEVFDWAQFLKDRARWKAEHRFMEKTGALAAVRARFNLMANFTVSEIVLSRPIDRHAVVSRFIRVALKSYHRNSFNTLVAIVYGLKSDIVNRAMKRSWGKLSLKDTRMLSYLKQYTSSVGSFHFIKQTVNTIADGKPVGVGARASVGGAGEVPSKSSKIPAEAPALSCVPFIGVYLSRLAELNQLPDFIDPTAPEQDVGIDPETSNFASLAHPEAFAGLAPLPSSIQLEPLINVHKQRMIAGVIKSLVTGQHLASKVQHPMDKKLFQKCLKLKALDHKRLEAALSRHSD